MSMNKKQRLSRIAVALALLALAAMSLHLWQGRSEEMPVMQAEPIGQDYARDVLRGEVSLAEAEAGRITGTLELRATNRTGQEQTTAVLRTLAGTSAKVSLSELTVDGEAAAWRADEDGLSAEIDVHWPEGGTLRIAFQFELTLERGAYPVGTDGEITLAVCALPTLATWNGAAWDTDVDALMETSYAEAFDAEVRFLPGEGQRLIFGGALVETGDGIRVARMTGARDISFAVTRSGVTRVRETGGVQVSAMAESGGQADRLLDAAQAALESLEKAGFAYPFATLAVVQTETGFEDGVIGSGLVALGRQSDKELLMQRLTRLIAQQTFGILVENDPYHAPWLSVSLASACELAAYRQRKGEAAYEERFVQTVEIASRLTRPHGVTVGASADRFGGDAEMTQVLRDQGGAMLMGIEQAVGQEAFAQALGQYAREKAGQIASQQELERALLEATGSAWDGYLEDELAY